jgi:ankyrin repeat protein
MDGSMRRSFLFSKVAFGCYIAAASAVVHAAAVDVRLIQAVRSQAVESVRALLKGRVDVNATQGDGTTPLHWAAEVDNLIIADLLIRAGARADVANDNGFTPLHLACTNRSGPMVERLLAAGANANGASLNGETVLMTCARAGDAKAVQALLVHGAKVNARESAHDQTALMWAAAQSHPDVVRLLVEAGADLRARSKSYDQTVVSEEETQRTGREELNYTVIRGGSTALLFTARMGDVESARILLAAGADSNDAMPDGTSALVLAAHSGRGAVAALLLDKGADPNGFGAGYTALHAAVLKSDVTLVKALLAHGANPNIRMTKPTPVRRNTGDFYLPNTLIGTTPYLLAAKFLEPDIMRALAAGGADLKLTMVNPPTQVKKPGDQKILIPDGATALMMAVGMGSSGMPGSGQPRSRRGVSVVDFGKFEPESRVLEGVRAAVSLGADVNAANEAGDTALHAAAAQGYDTVVQLLADHGAELNVKNKFGVTPLAAANGVLLSAPIVSPVTGRSASKPNVRHSTVALLRQLGATQ